MRLHSGLLAEDKLITVTEDAATILKPKSRSVQAGTADDFSVSPASTTFDPLYYMSFRGEDMIDRLTYFRDHAKDGELKGWTADERDGLLTIHFDDGNLTNEYVIDLLHGTLNKYESSQGKSLERWVWEYERAGEASVPKLLTTTSVYAPDDSIAAASTKARTVSRIIRWKENAVNHPATGDEFSTDAIDVKAEELR